MLKSRVGWVGLGSIIILLGTAPGQSIEQFSFKLPQPAQFNLEVETAASAKQGLQPASASPWLSGRDAANEPVEFGNRLVLQLSRTEDLGKLIAGSGLAVLREVVPGVYLLTAPDALTAARQAQRLGREPGVLASYPVMSRSASLDGAYAPRPNDPWFYVQWPLENRRTNDATRLGPDMNARAAWAWTKGGGVTVAIADMGVELDHPELINATAIPLHFNFDAQTTGGFPWGATASWAHGTEVAGLIAARQNNEIGMSGLAPAAQLASWVIFRTNQMLVDDQALMEMYQKHSNVVAVQNHSWSQTTLSQTGPTLLEQIGISNAVTYGRAGKGVVMVRSAGNDRERGGNANDDGHSTDPRVISVAAMRYDGGRVASYSEPGAPILVAAPSGETGKPGLFTTDLTGTRGVNVFNFNPPNEHLNDYAFDANGFSGTSAAAALISGAAALVLSANPNLTIRDVQQVLLLSARHYDFGDPDLRTNGAGLRVSHNLGFGVPDMGWAVQLARHWSNRPAQTNITITATDPAAIPDGGLRLLITGDEVPADLAAIPALGGTGPFADDPTPIMPIVDVGTAIGAVSLNLTGKVALIERSGDNWLLPITRVSRAGAALAVFRNTATGTDSCPGGPTVCPLLNTDFTPIPAVFINQASGDALKARLGQQQETWGQVRLFGTNFIFQVTNTLVCEHVCVRLQTDHPLRGDLRITLTSPQGTRSILQRFNQDTNAGPVDWTYTSTHHFFESSAGEWTLTVADQFPQMAGAVHFASLTIYGVAITDADHDGLDDAWETDHFGSLVQGPRDDPDNDGVTNVREQVMGTDPMAPDAPATMDLARWSGDVLRLTWPGAEGRSYTVWASTNAETGYAPVTNLAGQFPETEWCVTTTNQPRRFFRFSQP